jgi:1-acyl-sn-glycerol-3-phosphate acyltransferase
VARRRLGFWRRFAVVVIKPTMTIWTRRTWSGMENVPKDGGMIFAANHLSHADPLAAAHYVYDAGRWPQFLGKASLFRIPVLGWLIRKVGQIPVHRGTADAAKAVEAATAAVKDGCSVIIYPEGTTTREPDLWPMRGKTGVARLALATQAPVIPLVTWGTQRIFDTRTKKLGLRPRRPVTLVAGPAIDLSRWAGAAPTSQTLQEITETIMLRLSEILGEVRSEQPPPLWTSASTPASREAAGEGGQ